jgi:hypothetical protein
MQNTEKWHCFCDESYYHLWVVQNKERRDFCQAIHVNTQEEANYLVAQLNKLDRYEAAIGMPELLTLAGLILLSLLLAPWVVIGLGFYCTWVFSLFFGR